MDEVDPRVRVAEKVVQQVLRVDFRMLGAHPVFGLRHQVPDAFDQTECLEGGLLNPVDDVEDPLLPLPCLSHRLEEPVVFGLVAGDEAAEIENGNVQQPASGKVENVDDATDTSIAIGEWRSEAHTSELQSLMRIAYAV